MKTIPAIPAVVFVVALFTTALITYLSLPTVYRHGGVAVACQTAQMPKHASIDTATCQSVLKGRYEAVEVGPNF